MSSLTQPAPTTGAALRSDEDRWAAVVRRDATVDGTFVFSVRTTGVYCRPSCGARRARRENVAFFQTPAAAERAGFRPCKRCRPNGESLAERHAAVVAAACRQIEHGETSPTLDRLATQAGLSPFHFHRVFKSVTRVTPRAYVAAHRGQRVRDVLARAVRGTVSGAAYEAGFGSNGRFYEDAGKHLGMTPDAFRNGGANATIRFAVGHCALGAILVAATEAGVCAIDLGDEPDALERAFRERFPAARLVADDPTFAALVARVVAFVDAPGAAPGLPLDIRGTVFQRRVWQALTEIPAGVTATYTEVATRIGAPDAARAVAGACAANPLAVAIPCHRVVRQDGEAAGYRWGIRRKQALLAAEGHGG